MAQYFPEIQSKRFSGFKIPITFNYPSKTKSNVVVRWAIQKGVQPLPKSKNKSRISENFNVFDFELAEEDMMKLDSLTTLESMKLCVANYERKLYPFISFDN